MSQPPEPNGAATHSGNGLAASDKLDAASAEQAEPGQVNASPDPLETPALQEPAIAPGEQPHPDAIDNMDPGPDDTLVTVDEDIRPEGVRPVDIQMDTPSGSIEPLPEDDPDAPIPLDMPIAPAEQAHTGEKPIGEVISISGSKASVLLDRSVTAGGKAENVCPYIGSILTVDTGFAVVLCLITGMSVPNSAVDNDQTGTRIIEVDLVGELVREEDGYLRTFRRGVSVYPKLGDGLHVASHHALEKAYHFNNANSVEIGTIHQDPDIPAVIRVDEMLGKHFAIVGSTGSGKSCTVALVLQRILTKHPNAHIVLLDPHNEYDACFGDMSELVRLGDLSLPFWFLNFEEIVEILIGDANENSEEVEILREMIPIAKRNFTSGQGAAAAAAATAQKTASRRDKFTVDVPVPYRLSDIVALIDKQMGRLDMKNDLTPFKRLKARLESIGQDPRYDFMFGKMTVHDNLADILKRLFRIPVAGKPITVIQLMGLPSEIVNVVVSVLARLAFDLALWSDGRMPITFVCEEAHRYVPRDTRLGFEPTKRAISRIAKEGRKYGVSLCVVSQRPGDLDPTILSQCSTLFTMRLSNERDQEIIRSALPDSAEKLIGFLPSLGTRETIVFGEGVTLPSHILLAELPAETRPKGNAIGISEAWSADVADSTFVDEVVSRWRLIGQLPDDGSEAVIAARRQAAAQQAAQTQAATQQAQVTEAQRQIAAEQRADGTAQLRQLLPQGHPASLTPAQRQAQAQKAAAQQAAAQQTANQVAAQKVAAASQQAAAQQAAAQQAAAQQAAPRQAAAGSDGKKSGNSIADALAERFKKLNF